MALQTLISSPLVFLLLAGLTRFASGKRLSLQLVNDSLNDLVDDDSQAVTGNHKVCANSPRRAFEASILDKHNYYREQHPGVPPLCWDNTLAGQAQEWAENCLAGTHSGNIGVGENMYTTNSDKCSGDDCSIAVTAWYEEICGKTPRDKDCKSENEYNFDPPKFQPNAGHFTQVVWKSTEKVGCFMKECNPLKNPNGGVYPRPMKFLVCQYSPPGNHLDKFQVNIVEPDEEWYQSTILKK